MYFFLIAAACQKCQFVLFPAEQIVESTAGGIYSALGTGGKPTHGSEVTAVQQLSPCLSFSLLSIILHKPLFSLLYF